MSKEIYKFIVGSRLYQLTNPLSDYDHLVLVPSIQDINSVELNNILLDINNELLSFNDFKEKLIKHDLKCLEVYFNYYKDIIKLIPDIKYGIGFTINNSDLRRAVSSVASNSNVKAKKKIAQGDIYIGRKSFFHSYRILYMYTKLIDNSLVPIVYLNNDLSDPIINALDYSSETVQAHLRPIYNDIVLSPSDDTTTLYDRLKTKYDASMKELIHTLRINCPLDKDKNKEYNNV